MDVVLLNYEELGESEKLLFEWNLAELIPDFTAKGIDIEVFKGLTTQDIDNLIPKENFGIRIKFRMKLFEWRQANGYATPLAETLSVNTSISDWLNNSCTPEHNENKAQLDLRLLLNLSVVGRNLIKGYSANGFLTKDNRNTLVNIICQHWSDNEYQVSSQSHKEAATQILTIFPKEDINTYLGNENTRGKLAKKYYSLKRSLQQRGLISSNKRKALDINNKPRIESLCKNV